ncbi:hypothetical protein [Pedobacter sp. MC2016-24]|uniref:hypothetical protein n=1 Tax=Pedobacter sp. MC2016-24 TaxID=2780090 RepID=UPI0018830CAB|nr:hypothetical protein [Pedobacter sp. MC2016-24]MBE9599469.1 hypothetical protein [Pedobacter sp. MC2016-24]
MRKFQYFSLLLFGITVMYTSSFAQQKPTEQLRQKQQQRNFYRKTLQVDSAKAEQVAQVQDNYKQALKAIIADTSLNETARRARIEAAIAGKNQRLKQLLNPAQQARIIPTTELTPSPVEKKP